MSEWMNTLDMIKVLDTDEKAKTRDGTMIMEWDEHGISFRDTTGTKFTRITKGSMKIQWRKELKRVSFIEAMRALEHGETITLHKHNAICEFNSADNIKVIDRFGPCATFSDFVYANWSIKD